MIYLVYFLSVVERTSFRKNKIIKMVKEYFSLGGYCEKKKIIFFVPD